MEGGKKKRSEDELCGAGKAGERWKATELEDGERRAFFRVGMVKGRFAFLT